MWYILIPLSWAILLDIAIAKHWFKIISVAILALLFCTLDFVSSSELMFDRSADFLLSFRAVGSDYVSSSVIICLLVPIAVYVLLIAVAIIACLARRRKLIDGIKADLAE